MARPEIPSIVVHNGSASAPGSPNMELPSRALMPTRSLSKQTSLVDEEDLEEGNREGGDLRPLSPSAPSSHPPSLPVTPPSPSPAVSPCSPPVSTPASSSSPGHFRSGSPSSGSPGRGSTPNLAASPSSLPQGPGPGGGSVDGETMAVGHGGPAGPSCLSSPGTSSRSKSLELPQQRSSDSEKDAPLSTSNRHRHHHGSKLKLLQRSHAMQEDTSPPPDIMDPMQGPHGQMPNNLTVCQPPMGCPGGPPRRRLRHQGSSSQGSFEGSSPCLSRDSSMEYTDSTGVDLLPFIIQTLHKNQKDRMLLLKIERELVNIVKDPKRTYHKFPHMSSYQRMLVHRVAAFFGMEHNVDQVGTCVIVNKTRNTRLPEARFREHIREDFLPPDEPRRSILRRGFASFEEETSYKSPDRLHGIESRRSKSFEEREEEYEKVRRRIFSEESFSMECMSDSPRRFHDPFVHHHSRRNSHEDARWHDYRHLPIEEPESHRKHHYDNHRIRPNRLPKGESFDSDDCLNPRSLRPPVFKSHSFGGYSGGVTVLSRGDSVASNPSSRLSKQDSTGSRFSDHSSSSGYKTQRQDTSSTNVSNTLSTTPSPTTGQYQHPPFTQSGQPYTNADGSVYRFDPSNPPPVVKSSGAPKMPAGQSKEREDKRMHDVKCDSVDPDEGIEGVPCGPGRGPEGRDLAKLPHRRGNEEPPNHPQYFHASHMDAPRSYSQEDVSNVGAQLRQLSLSGSGSVSEGPPDMSPVSVGAPLPPQGYVVPRQQYHQQPVYYMPPSSIQNLSGGGMKYVYPQYQVAPAQNTGSVQSTNLVGASMQSHPPPVHSLTNMPALPTLPQQIPGPGPPQHPTPVPEANAHLPPGYIPNNYAVVAYPPNGLLSTVASSGAGHESGGTTYYCQIAGPAAIAPPATAGSVTAPGGAPTPAVSLQQFAPNTSTSSSFPVAMGYYTGSGMNNNGIYHQAPGMQGAYPGGIYGGPQSHAGVGQPPGQGAVSYRAPTPPHTPSTQGVSVPLGFNSAGTPGGPVPPAGVGGQYIAVLPPPQPPTPTSHASQLFSTFFRPSVQMMSGSTSTGTPPPQPVLQYGGVSAPLSNPHPPVFAKPYVGSSMHPLIPGGSGEPPQGGGGGAVKEENKRYVGSVGAYPHSGGPAGPPVAPLTGPATAHLLPRPYTFMQS